MSNTTPIEWLACGAELAHGAEVPELLAQLMEHVAVNLQAHARWVGTATVAAANEHDALVSVAAAYRSIAEAARETASRMHQFACLEPAPHDSTAWDAAAFRQWMQQKIALQTQLAELLLGHASASAKHLPTS